MKKQVEVNVDYILLLVEQYRGERGDGTDREVETLANAPLAAGFLWLLGIWLLVADHIPAKHEATGGLRPLIDLGDKIGRISLGAVAIAAYIPLILETWSVIVAPRRTADLGDLFQRARLDAAKKRSGSTLRHK